MCPPLIGVGDTAATAAYLSLQRDGVEGLVALHDADEQADPGRGAERAAHLGQQGDAADEAQGAPAAVLLQGHQAVGVEACRRRREGEAGEAGGENGKVIQTEKQQRFRFIFDLNLRQH